MALDDLGEIAAKFRGILPRIYSLDPDAGETILRSTMKLEAFIRGDVQS